MSSSSSVVPDYGSTTLLAYGSRQDAPEPDGFTLGGDGPAPAESADLAPTSLLVARQTGALLERALDAARSAPPANPPPGGIGGTFWRLAGGVLAGLAKLLAGSDAELNVLKLSGQVPHYISLRDMQDASTALEKAGVSTSAYSLDGFSLDQVGQFLRGLAALGAAAATASPQQLTDAIDRLYTGVRTGNLAPPQAAEPPGFYGPLPPAGPPAPGTGTGSGTVAPPATGGGTGTVTTPPVTTPPVTTPPDNPEGSTGSSTGPGSSTGTGSTGGSSSGTGAPGKAPEPTPVLPPIHTGTYDLDEATRLGKRFFETYDKLDALLNKKPLTAEDLERVEELLKDLEAQIPAYALAQGIPDPKDFTIDDGLVARARAALAGGPTATGNLPAEPGSPLSPDEQEDWAEHTRRNPWLVPFVQEPDADEASRNAAMRSILSGASPAEILRWLQDGGLTNGRPPSGPPNARPTANGLDPDEGRRIVRYVDDQWLEDLERLSQPLKDALAGYLQQLLDNLPPGFEFFRTDFENALRKLRGAGASGGAGAGGAVPDNITVRLAESGYDDVRSLYIVETLRSGVTGTVPFEGLADPDAPVPSPANAPRAQFESAESAARRFVVPHPGYEANPVFSQHASAQATNAARGIQDGTIGNLTELWETLTRERYVFQRAQGSMTDEFGFNRVTRSHVDPNAAPPGSWSRPNQLSTPLGDERYRDYIPQVIENANDVALSVPGAPTVPGGEEVRVRKFYVDEAGNPRPMQSYFLNEPQEPGASGVAYHTPDGDARRLFESAQQMYNLAMSGTLTRQETVEALARMYYRLANSMPNVRGSAAVAHETLVAAGRALGIEFPPMAQGKVLDLEATTAGSEDQFVRGFAGFFNGPIAFRTSSGPE